LVSETLVYNKAHNVNKDMLGNDKTIFKILSERFNALRPIFFGQDRWKEYKQVFDVHNKLSKKKLSQVDFRYNISLLSRTLYAFENGVNINDLEHDHIPEETSGGLPL